MGKKKRAIHRTRKFASKYFNFLDKVDGVADDTINIVKDSKLLTPPLVDTITVTDLGNQTARLEGTLLGGINPAQDTVLYSINDASLSGDERDINDDGTGEGNFQISARAGTDFAMRNVAGDGNHVFTAGRHKVKVVVEDNGTQQGVRADKVKRFSIKAAKVDISAIAVADGNGGDNGKILITSESSLDVTPADADVSCVGCAAGEVSFNLGIHDGSTKNTLHILVKDKTGAEVGLSDEADYDLDGNAAITRIAHTDLTEGSILKLVAATAFSTDEEKNPHTVTITPRAKDGTLLTADAIIKSVPIVA